MSIRWLQWNALVRKSALVKIRNRRATCIEVLYPCLFMLILVFITSAGKQSGSIEYNQPSFGLTSLNDALCFPRGGCFPLGFAPNTSLTNRLIDRVRPTYRGSFIPFSSGQELQDYYFANPFRLWGGVIFDNVDTSGSGSLLPNSGFTVVANQSFFFSTGSSDVSLYASSGFMSLQSAVADSILTERTNGQFTVHSDIKVQSFPRIPSNSATAAEIWPFYTIVAFLLVMNQIVIVLVNEKSEKLKEGLLMMGCSESSYWLSIFAVQGLLQCITVLLILAIAYVFRMIVYSNFLLVFILFFLFSLTIILLACIVSNFFNSTRGATTGGFLVMIVAIGMYAFARFYAFDQPVTDSVKNLLSLLSPVAFGMAFYSIGVLELQVKSGLTFENVSQVGTMYPIANSFYMLFIDVILYWVILWYITKVYKGEYGTALGPCFFLNPEFWCPPKFESGLLGDYESTERGLVIENLKKTFGGGRFFCKSPEVQAVKDLNLSIGSGQILALLGHNGAGKTTTLSMLTGLYPPTSGDARFMGMSIRHDMDEIRRNLGVCPQHDVLFGKLTAREHIRLYGAIKGLQLSEADINKSLSDVALLNDADTLTENFSGGMKRRLSAAIAFVGDPKIVFLDEPSSGVDPESRRRLWHILQRVKSSKIIILTTHSMEEADTLADYIAIMSFGRLKCFGTSLDLKSEFGLGYNLEMVTTANCNKEALAAFVGQYIPNMQVLSSRGAESLFLLPLSSVDRFPNFLSQLDASRQELGVQAYGLSMTTLEEVFLKIIEVEEAGEQIDIPNIVVSEEYQSHLSSARLVEPRLQSPHLQSS